MLKIIANLYFLLMIKQQMPDNFYLAFIVLQFNLYYYTNLWLCLIY